ncbi:phage portal protein [Mesorhizobium sp. B3-1-9]|uniref:phage portal protein n=1 Tax=Mesorhizobium sp. B3-1-9 TaxID=2589892 RepID=UPI00112D52EB|nr:phage portal protein [Mesorhizobium sp. B3-1-9]TPI39305.1 phage portal protein [Mesorhizobium sp. B3-1-9]
MSIFDWFRRSGLAPEAASSAVHAMAGEAAQFYGMDDPRLLEFIRNGGEGLTEAGLSITAKAAMKNPTVLRCVSLISFSIGMLPLHLHRKADSTMADDHPLFRILHRRPNAWQTAFEFRSLMQQNALGASGSGQRGDAFALIVRSGTRIIQLVPLPTDQVTTRQKTDWSLEYVYNKPNGGQVVLPQTDVFHLRYGLSEDGISGLSLVKQAAEAIALAIQTEKAAARLFRNGMVVGGALKHKDKLSPEAYERLKSSMEAREGAANAHKWLILEEGMDITPGGTSGRDSQAIEQRKYQGEEISRPFGVPRPLLNLDETNWGTGVDVLGQFFVRFGLNPWFEAWQQAIVRCLLTEKEAELYEPKFNAGALLRGSMKDQAEFFAKGLGAGGQQPFLEVDEVRGWLDLPHSDNLPPPLGQSNGAANEPAKPA